jgi:hypothetical protein
MAANNIRVLFDNRGKDLVIPIEQTWDFQGQQQAVEEYEAQVVAEILNKDQDFEVNRFVHKEYDPNKSSINYDFYFWSSTTNPGVYTNSYLPRFTPNQIYYYTGPFVKSFWKLDFYTTPQNRDQQAYITIILPTQLGLFQQTLLNNTTNVTIRKPSYSLDYIGDKEGFFLYWLKKRNFLDINTFYMTAKFFDGSTGEFTKFMNQPQNTLANPTDFPGEEYFYYKVDLDYIYQTYEVFSYPNIVRSGTVSNPIKWYEYVNP